MSNLLERANDLHGGEGSLVIDSRLDCEGQLTVPCPVPYQGSKRGLAPQILAWLPPRRHDTFFEPFAGSAAMTLAVAKRGRARRFVLSDILEPLAQIWKIILEDPERLASEYAKLWNDQLDNPRRAYDRIRGEFNATGDPANLLYLIARCVKNAIRFNPQGEFNQSPDNRRLGMRPQRMRQEILAAHALLVGKTAVLSVDYRELLRAATPQDVVYMDPPYQGVSAGRDRRYFQALDLEAFIAELARLNNKGISFLVSFDGRCGSRTYGHELPAQLGLKRVLLIAGRSTQATLLGRDDVTVESLYVSPALLGKLKVSPLPVSSGISQGLQLSFPG